jgi:hypothetical protein
MKQERILQGLQWRLMRKHHMLSTSLGLTVVYGLLFSFVGEVQREGLLVISLLSDPAVMALFFAAVMTLWEKNDRIWHALAVLPIPRERLMISRVLAITLMSVLASVLMLIFSGLADILPIVMTSLAMLVVCAQFAFLGCGLAFRVQTTNDLMFETLGILALFSLPLSYYFGLGQGLWLLMNPTSLSTYLILGGLQAQWTGSYLLLWGLNFILLFLLYVYARKQMLNYLKKG